jgi:hypothetical protein
LKQTPECDLLFQLSLIIRPIRTDNLEWEQWAHNWSSGAKALDYISDHIGRDGLGVRERRTSLAADLPPQKCFAATPSGAAANLVRV